MKKTWCIYFLCLFIGTLCAQIPKSSMYLLHIENPEDSSWKITKLEYLSGFNNKGYNNQPCFLSATEILASIRLPNQNQNDIYKFDLNKKTITNITESQDSEYTPRSSPSNSKNINCVSVPTRDTSIQNLIEVKIESGEIAKTIFDNFSKIGYYRHLKDHQWICYLVEEPHVLSICDASKKTKKIFASSIGRSFEVLNQNEVIFVHKITSEQWKLKSYNFQTDKARTIAEMPIGTEDFYVTDDGHYYCANNSKILRLDVSGKWHTLIDVKPLNINYINRLALYKNRMVIVSVPKL